MHSTGAKGDIGVAAVTADLLERGFDVLLPLSSTSPYDLVATDGNKFWKIQVKYVSEKNGKVWCEVRRTVITNSKISRRRFHQIEIDVVAVYCPQWKQVCYVAMQDVVSVTIRQTYPANGIKNGIRLASEHMRFPPT